MAQESPKIKGGALGLVAALVGLWPIVLAVTLWALAQWGGEGEFSLDPRDTSRNVIALIAALGITLVADAGAIFLGLRGARKGAPRRGRAIATAALGIFNALIIIVIVALALVLRSMVPAGPGGKMKPEERVAKCQNNQKNIATALGPDMWGFDHADMKPEELKNLDLSPKGDLIENDTGLSYLNDPSVLDCPADDDPTDVDYAVEIKPDGSIKVNCIDPKGVKEGHSK